MTLGDSELGISERPQKTIRDQVSFSGIGIHSGKWVELTLSPALANTGIQFQRSDIPESPSIPAIVDSVVDTRRCTVIGKHGFCVGTIEHLCAALKAYEVDNVLVRVSDQELPIGDGSAKVFVDLIEQAGIQTQECMTPILTLNQPIYWADEKSYMMALPYDGVRFSYSLHYPNSEILQNQFHSHLLLSEDFKKEIAPCRTFACYEEVQPLMDRGLIKGGSLENTVVIKDGNILNEGGIRFENEMARHKLLDMVGDFSLTGLNIHAHIIGHRTGHQANIQFASQLCKVLKVKELQCQPT